MAVGKYYKYKCKSCGYVFTKFQSDALLPVVCPKCGGEVEVISSSITNSPINVVINAIKDLFLRKS